MIQFKKAARKGQKARIALCGPSGSGKTFTALLLASTLGERVAVLDTEHGSASLYADRFAFDVVEQEQHSPRNYIETIKAAEQAGYEVLVIDSLSHAWMGKGGALEMVDNAASRSSGNSFAAWRSITPLHNELVETILGSRLHIVATMRSKSEWVIEEDSRGKKVPRKVGMAPVQRDGIEFEFQIVGDLDQSNTLMISKSRCAAVAPDAVIQKPGVDFGKTIREWLESGAPYEAPPAGEESPAGEGKPAKEMATPAQLQLIEKVMQSHVFTDKEKRGLQKRIDRGMTKDQASEAADWLTTQVRERKAAEKDQQEVVDAYEEVAMAGAGSAEPPLPFGAED